MPVENKSRWLVLAMFMLAHGVNDGFSWILPPLLPFIREYFHLSYTDMGAFFSVFRFSGSIMQAPVSYLVHWVPASSVLVGGLIWSSVGMFLASLSSGYATLFWLSAISGVGRATYHPLAVTILSRIFGRNTLGRAIGLHLSGSGVGMVLAPFMAGLFLRHFSWRMPLQVWCAMGFAAGVALTLFLRHHQHEVNLQRHPLSWPFFSRALVVYVMGSSVWGIAQGGFMAFMALFLVDQRGFLPQEAATAYGIMSLAGLLCRPFIGALMDRMGRRKPVIIAGYLISACSILAVLNIGNRWLLMLPLILLGIFGSGHSGLADTFMIESIPSHRREETLGFVYTLRMGISAISPLLVGFSSERITIDSTFLFLAMLAASAALVIFFAEEKPPA